jgi:hypothetical protein
MESVREQVPPSQNGRDPGRRSIAQLEHDAVDLTDLQLIAIHQLLVQHLSPKIHVSHP